MLQPSNRMGNEDRKEAASVSPSLSSQSDQQRYVLNINILPEPSSKVGCRRKNVSIMSINQGLSESPLKPFVGNLSDDQKLVLSVNDGTTSKSSNDMKILCGSMNRIILSGKCSPYDEHFDSGTCSDAEVISFQPLSESPQPPPLPPKLVRSGRQKNYVLSESFCSDTSSASSSDSVQQSDHMISVKLTGNHLESPTLIRSISDHRKTSQSENVGLLPTSLLIDIRNRSVEYENDNEARSDTEQDTRDDEHDVDENELNFSSLELCNRDSVDDKMLMNCYSDDSFYKFHINEHLNYDDLGAFKRMSHDESDESFAGLKDFRSGTATIRSKNGTIRGIKNRVRSGISTFLQMQETTVKNYKDKDGGKIVLYTTSMGVVRSTYAKCQTVKKILNTLMVKYEERDVFMSQVHQMEIRERMESDEIEVPHLFVDGQYIGNADQVERFNETGDLRKMLKSFKCLDSIKTCRTCGGFNMLPCSSCGGSKKSIHRNNFTNEFVALKCMNCDEVGLVKCYTCCS